MHEHSKFRSWSRGYVGVLCCGLLSQFYTVFGLNLRIYNLPQLLLG